MSLDGKRVSLYRKALKILSLSEKMVFNSLSDESGLFIFVLDSLSQGPLSRSYLYNKCRRKKLMCRKLSGTLDYMLEMGLVKEMDTGELSLLSTGLDLSEAISGFKKNLLEFIELSLMDNVTENHLIAELLAPLTSTVSVAFLDREALDRFQGLSLHGYICMLVAAVLSNTYEYSPSLRKALDEAERLFLSENSDRE